MEETQVEKKKITALKVLCILNCVFLKHICMVFLHELKKKVLKYFCASKLNALCSCSRMVVLVRILGTSKEKLNLRAESDAVEKL